MVKNFTIKEDEIEVYGDDLRALIKAFANSIRGCNNSTIKEDLEFLKGEIEFILKYEDE